MIEGNFLTYPGAKTGFKWQPENEILYAFLVTIFSTIIVFQATAIVFDLIFGMNERGKVRISDIGCLLLVEESSIFSWYSSLFPGSHLTAMKFHGFRARGTTCSPESKNTTTRALITFLVLLIASPAINIMGVILAVEHDTVVSFQEANFGGIAVGVNDEPKFFGHRICSLHETKFSTLEHPIAEVFTCVHATSHEHPSKFPSGVTGTLRVSTNVEVLSPIDSIVVEFRNATFSFRIFFHVDISVGKFLYRVKSKLTAVNGAKLVSDGVQRLLANCTSPGSLPLEQQLFPKTSPLAPESWIVAQNMTCAQYPQQSVIKDSEWVSGRLGIVNSNELLVLNVTDSFMTNKGNSRYKYIPGAGLPLLRRRRSYAPIVHLGISALSLVVLRVVVWMLTRNDIYQCVELLLKYSFGLPTCDSMLQYDRKVRHDWFGGAAQGEDAFQSLEDKLRFHLEVSEESV